MRYKSRFFMMVVGIGGCTALLLTGFGLKDSIVDVAKMQYGEIQLYDMTVSLEEDFSVDGENIAREAGASGAVSWLAASEKTMDVKGRQAVKSTSVVIVQDPARAGEFLDLHTKEKESLEWPKAGEAIMDEGLAKACGIREGDTVTLENEDGEEVIKPLWADFSVELREVDPHD